MDSCGIMKNSTPISATIPTSVEVWLPPPKLVKSEVDQTTAGPNIMNGTIRPTGEPFTSHEWVLEPAQEGESELVPITIEAVSVRLVELVPLEVQSHAEIPFPGLPVWHAEVVADNGASVNGGISPTLLPVPLPNGDVTVTSARWSKYSTYLTTNPEISIVRSSFCGGDGR